MNKYIKSDLESATKYMKAAIMNALYDIDTGEEKDINLGPNLSMNLFVSCLEETGWKLGAEMKTNGWQIDFWDHWISPSGKYVTIEGSLYKGQNYRIVVDDEE